MALWLAQLDEGVTRALDHLADAMDGLGLAYPASDPELHDQQLSARALLENEEPLRGPKVGDAR